MKLIVTDIRGREDVFSVPKIDTSILRRMMSPTAITTIRNGRGSATFRGSDIARLEVINDDERWDYEDPLN